MTWAFAVWGRMKAFFHDQSEPQRCGFSWNMRIDLLLMIDTPALQVGHPPPLWSAGSVTWAKRSSGLTVATVMLISPIKTISQWPWLTWLFAAGTDRKVKNRGQTHTHALMQLHVKMKTHLIQFCASVGVSMLRLEFPALWSHSNTHTHAVTSTYTDCSCHARCWPPTGCNMGFWWLWLCEPYCASNLMHRYYMYCLYPHKSCEQDHDVLCTLLYTLFQALHTD